METEYENSRIERAKRSLYGTGNFDGATPNSELTPADIDVANNWGDTEIVTEREIKKNKTGIRVLKYIVVLAIVTVFCSGGYLVYQILDPFSKPSDKNILITFDIPVGINPGIPADVLVHVSNQNKVALEYANLTLVYPSGSKDASKPGSDLRETKKSLGVIEPGASAEYHTRAIFLGEENTNKELRANLEFRFPNINSVFSKEVTRELHLLASPINLTVDTLKQVNAGQEIEVSAIAASNTVIPLDNVLLKIEYPVGFTVTDTSPKPTFGNNIWRIGTLDPSNKYAVKVKGVLLGKDTQEKVFLTTIGTGNDQTERNIQTLYSTVLSRMTIQKSFIGIQLFLGDKPAEEAISHAGEAVTGTILWVNNLPTRVINAQIEVRLSGAALDRSTIKASSGGFYRSSDDTIIWDERGDEKLADVESGGSGSVKFSFAPNPSISGSQLLTNQTISAEVTVRGKRISESGVPEEVKTVNNSTVKVSSQTQFKPWVVHYSGPFANTGPVPPRVEQETMYTIWWSIRNTSNALSKAEARATLPQSVRWSGSVSPTDADISYDPVSHQVVWKAGDIPVGAGYGSIPPREVAFQLILTPSLSQLKTAPKILNGIVFSGIDSFTGEVFTDEKGDLGTILSTEPRAPKESGVVTE